MDLATIVGLLLAIGGILGGQVLEGGHVSSIMQGTAAIIVLGGTIGAVMIGSTMEDLKTAMKLVKLAFFDDKTAGPEKIVEEIVEAAQIARKGTILALEKKLPEFSHPYMQSVFKFVIDGVESKTIQELFENEIMMEEAHLGAGRWRICSNHWNYRCGIGADSRYGKLGGYVKAGVRYRGSIRGDRIRGGHREYPISANG